VWSQTLGKSYAAGAQSIIKTSDGNFVVATITDSTSTTNMWSALVKITNQGDTIWTKKYIKGIGYAVKQTSDGGLMLAGSTNLFACCGNLLLVKTDANGNTTCYAPPANFIKANAATIENTITLAESSGLDVHHPIITVSQSPKLITTICFTTAIDELQNEEGFTLYPNPSNGWFTLLLPNEATEITVVNMLGEEVIKTKATQKKIDLQLNNNGLYLVVVKTKDRQFSKKIIVNK
jgi:hypothetical protein